MVTDNPAREAGENRSQSGESFDLRDLSNGRGGGAQGVVQGDLGADRTVVATTPAGENGVTLQNVEISLWQEQGGRSGCVPERQE